MLSLKEIIAACGHILVTDNVGRPKAGTGYLIASDCVATCAHVVEDAIAVNVIIDFDGTKKQVKIIRMNKDSDCAVLEMIDPLAGVQPLQLGECEWKADWDSYGFPELAKGAGQVMMGVVYNPEAKDDLQAPVLELFAPKVAAGMSVPIHGFSGSPVIVDGVVVGHLKRILSDPEHPLRAALGTVYATRSACVWSLLNDGKSGDSPPLPSLSSTSSAPQLVQPPPPDSIAYARHHQKIRKLFQEWSSQDLPPGLAGLVAADSLIQLGEPEEALNMLAAVPASIRNDQLHALALAKIGKPETLDKSIEILENLRNAGHFDAETGGLLGGRYKQVWQRSLDTAHLRKSHDMYLCTFETTKNPYPGINAAATALWLDEKPTSEEIAHRILALLDYVTLEATDTWDLATKGEALLLTGDVNEAKNWYARAAERCNYATGTLQIMRQQAKRDLDALGLDVNTFDDIFKQK